MRTVSGRLRAGPTYLRLWSGGERETNQTFVGLATGLRAQGIFSFDELPAVEERGGEVVGVVAEQQTVHSLRRVEHSS